jgi:hypothetical protein
MDRKQIVRDTVEEARLWSVELLVFASEQVPLACCCEDGKEYLSYGKGGEFLDQLSDCYQPGPC